MVSWRDRYSLINAISKTAILVACIKLLRTRFRRGHRVLFRGVGHFE